MANLKSQQITNRDASPPVLTNPNDGASGMKRSAFGQVAVTTSEVAGNVLRILEVPSNARISSVRAWTTAISTAGAADVGVYRNTRDGGAAVDPDFFASAQVLTSALSGVEISGESGVYTVDKREQPLWKALGLASDPQTTFDIAFTITTNLGGSGNLGVEVDWVN